MTVSQNPLVCHGHSRPIVEVNYSATTPDGYFLTSASKDGQPMLRNGESGDWVGTFQGHKGAVWSCVLNTPALLAATGSADFTSRVWDALSGDELHSLPHNHIVRTVQFAEQSDGVLATAGMEKKIRKFDLSAPESPEEFEPTTAGVRCMQWLHNDNTLLSSCVDKINAVQVWDVRTKKVVREIAHDAPATSIEKSACGGYITTASGTKVRIFNAADLTPIKEFDLPYSVESASLCWAKQRFIAGGEDMWAHLYDLETGAELETNKGHHGPVHTMRFAPDGESYASGSEDGTIRIWTTDYALKMAQQGQS